MSEQGFEVVEAPYTTNKIVVHGNLGEKPTERRATVEGITRSLVGQREAILRMPSVEDGINMDRVYGYCDEIGFPKKEIRILEPTDYNKALQIAGQSESADALQGGQYMPGLDIVVVKRDREKEALNGGPEVTESILIHEIAHGSDSRPTTRINVSTSRRFLRKIISGTSTDIRMGFIVENKTGEAEGFFLEEGYAELERGLYVADVLGKPGGFGEGVQPGTRSLLDRYTYQDREDGGPVYLNFPRGAIPAATLSLLMERDAELLHALRDSRRTVEGKREVVRRIDEVSPGLYQELRKAGTPTPENRTGELFHKVKKLVNNGEKKK